MILFPIPVRVINLWYNFSHRYYGTRGFYVITMTLDLKSGFLIWKFVANNLDLDGTRVYAVVTRSFAASLP